MLPLQATAYAPCAPTAPTTQLPQAHLPAHPVPRPVLWANRSNPHAPPHPTPTAACAHLLSIASTPLGPHVVMPLSPTASAFLDTSCWTPGASHARMVSSRAPIPLYHVSPGVNHCPAPQASFPPTAPVPRMQRVYSANLPLAIQPSKTLGASGNATLGLTIQCSDNVHYARV